jgi:Kae1-associated kinase Bud32
VAGEGDARVIYRGAEADLLRGRWCGLDAVFKFRRPLIYRLKVLDDAIRRQRTAREAEMIHDAKRSGAHTPLLYFVDTGNALIVMQWVKGRRLKEAVSSLTPEVVASIFAELGGEVARLHSSGIMHGDLTTSNVLLDNDDNGDDELTLIDFGLAIRTTRLEDRAVDLRLVKETLTGAHSEVASKAYAALLEGYGGEVGAGEVRAVTRQVAEIERRGRYARVE